MAEYNQALAEQVEFAGLADSMGLYLTQHKREFPPTWYTWQHEGFFCHHRQVMTLAGNQTGKSWSGGYHFACDITQDYPDDWEGFKFDHCINTLVIGVDKDQLDVIQGILFGTVVDHKWQGGWIHPDEIQSTAWSRTASNMADRVVVHGKFGLNTIHLRSYSQIKTGQGTLKFAGKVFDLIWADEQPPDELMGQLSVRLLNGNMGKGGRMRMTMTPELGKTDLIIKFMDERGENQHLIGPVSWDECSHMTPEAQSAALELIPEFEHDLRKNGTPSFGSGMVYAIAEERIKCDPFVLPEYFRCIRAVDLGINHPQATVWLAHDPQQDIVYLVKTYSAPGQDAASHAVTTNSMWPETTCVVPHDFDTTEKGSGEMVSRYYRQAGLKHTKMFSNPNGGNHVEPGVMEVLNRMREGRFKVFSTCTEFWREHRLYHRDEGKIVKKNDDVMDAARYGTVMIGRYGRPASGRIIKGKTIRAMAGKDRR
jgi:phage terminase large subunit-like protein